MGGKEEKGKGSEETPEVDQKALEKSWSDAMGDLKKSLGVATEEKPLTEEEKKAAAEAKAKEELAKAAKGKPSDEEEESTEESTSESEEEPPPPAKKSLDEIVAGDDEEAEIAMDIEPYLKSLAKGIDKVVTEKTASLPKLQKAVKELSDMVRTMAKVVLANAEMQKSISDTVEKIGKLEIPSMSRLSKAKDRFDTGEGGKEMTRLEIMNKAIQLCSQGKLTTTDVTILEGRLNKGMEIPEEMKPLFKVNKEEK